MKNIAVWLAFGVLTMTIATEVDLPAYKDATVDESLPDWKGGIGSWIAVYYTPAITPYFEDGLIGFDLSAYNGSTVNQAILKLYADDYLYSGPMEIYRIAESWVESTITWNTKPGVNKDMIVNYQLPALTNSWHQIDVKGIVGSWLSGSFSNNGFYLQMVAQPGKQTGGAFVSKEGSDPSKRPILHLDYKPANVREEGKTSHPGPVTISYNHLSSSIIINFSLGCASWITLRVYDASGRAIEKLIDNPVSAGSHQVTLDTRKYQSGVYFLRFEQENYTLTGKVVVLR